MINNYCVKHEFSCSDLKLNEYPETIWNLNSYSHNAEKILFQSLFI